MTPPGPTSQPLSPEVYFYIRHQGSDTVGSCKSLELLNNWEDSTDWSPSADPAKSQVGTVANCDSGVSPHTMHRSGSNFVLINPAGKNVFAMRAPTTPRYIEIIPQADGTVQFRRFPAVVRSQSDVEAHYRSVLTRERTVIHRDTRAVGNQGSMVRFELDFSAPLGQPRWDLGTDLQGNPLTHADGKPMTGFGMALRLRPMFPKSGIYHWFHPLRLTPEFSHDWGSVSKAYTARGDDEGDYSRWHIGGRFGVELSAEWLRDSFNGEWRTRNNPMPVDFVFGWDMLFAGYREMSGSFAGHGAALAYDVQASGFVWNEHRVYAGLQFRPKDSSWCLGAQAFFSFNEDLQDHQYRDAFVRPGATLTTDTGRYRSSITTTRSETRPFDLRIAHPGLATISTPAPVEPQPAPLPPPMPQREPVPQPPVPTTLPKAKPLPLGDLAGWKASIDVYFPTGKITLEQSDHDKVLGLLSSAGAIANRFPGSGLGYTFLAKFEAHADTRGRPKSNVILTMGRAFTAVSTAAEKAAASNFDFVKPGSLRAVGRGESEARDVTGKIIPNIVNCKQGRTFKDPTTRHLMRKHKCDSIEYIEPLQKNRRVRVTAEWLPPGAIPPPSKENISTEQLGIDQDVGPRLARALRQGRSKFPSALYEPKSNRFFVMVDTLDARTLKKLNAHLIATGKKVQKLAKAAKHERRASFTIELVLAMDNPPADFQNQLRKTFYNFKTFPFAGGLRVSQAKTGTKLADLQRDAAHRETTASGRAAELFAGRFTAGGGMYTIVPVAIPDTSTISKTQQLTLFKLAKLAEEKLAKSPDALLTVGLVNLTEDPNPELMAVGGYAVKSASRNFRGFYAMNDVRLGNTIYLVFMPNTVAADAQTKLDDAKSPQVQGLMTELLKQAGVPLKTSARNRGTTAHIDLPGASTPITR